MAELFDCLVEAAAPKASMTSTWANHFVGDAFLFQQAADGLGNLIAALKPEQNFVVFHFSGRSMA